MKKKEALQLGTQTATTNGHDMGEYWKNGKGLQLAKCSSCGLMVVVRKVGKKEWEVFGTSQNYDCEKEDA